MERLKRWVRGAWRWLTGLPPAWLAVLGGVVLAGAAAGGVFMYRTYQFVEHDNQFCLSCHLMVDPYERFAQSAHQGLGCKACHQPTFVERSRMALSQIIENPEEITTHAHVPNRACAACHIEGDPERWRSVRSSVGHRVHLESDDPALRGLMCVECHSTSIHEFAPSDRTCAQSGCHEDTRIRLGRMQDLTIHCVACHDFSRPVPDTARVHLAAAPLQPGRQECLTCHAMRVLVADMPEDEPHERVCGACHNPHEQATPREAERTCAQAGCHAQPDTLTPMHRGLAVGVLQDCLACHSAHTFRVAGDDCLGCHRDIYQDAPRRIELPQARAAARGGGAGMLPALWAALRGQAPPPRRPLEFWHARHRDVECAACHSSEQAHGALTVTSVRDCRSCHHTAPVAATCTTCHSPAELRQPRYRVPQTVRLSVAPPKTRELPFSHRRHEAIACATCHTEPLTLRATAQCSGCHEEHHRPGTECLGCHTQPPATAHTVEAHLGCSGAGCHDPVPAGVRNVPRTRSFCLACHQDLVQHEPGGNCADCHRLPRPRPQGRANVAGPSIQTGGGR